MDDSAIQVSRIYRVDGESKLKAFADVSFAGDSDWVLVL